MLRGQEYRCACGDDGYVSLPDDGGWKFFPVAKDGARVANAGPGAHGKVCRCIDGSLVRDPGTGFQNDEFFFSDAGRVSGSYDEDLRI